MHPKYYKNRLVKEVLDTVGSSQDVKSLNSVVIKICIREHIDYKTLKSWIDLDRQHGSGYDRSLIWSYEFINMIPKLDITSKVDEDDHVEQSQTSRVVPCI